MDSFVKSNSAKDGKKYALSAHTGSRAFTKVVMDSHGPSMVINTISVRAGGRANAIPITARLHEGRNEFNVPIPQGATEMFISCREGQGAEVKVYIE